MVYGHLVEATMRMPKTSWFDLLKTHWANYLCVTIILGLPVIILSFLYDDMGYIQKTTINNLNGFIINCLAIYIWPLVFLRKQIKNPIVQGISTILKNIKVSIPLILLTFVIFAVKFLVALSMLKLLPLTTLKAFLVGFAQNVITVYLGLIIFTAATIFIKEQTDKQTNQQEFNK